MARRSDHSRTELSRLALDAARGIVEKQGLDALTTRNIADAIGYSPGTLYNVFENLDDLIVRLNAQTLDILYRQLSDIPMTGDAGRDLRALLAGYRAFQISQPALWTTLFDYRLTENQVPPDWYLAKVDRVMALIERALAPLFCTGEREDLENAARILWAGIHGICSLSHAGKLGTVSSQSTEDMTETLLACFVYSLESLAERRSGMRPSTDFKRVALP